MLPCIQNTQKHYQKDEVILMSGDLCTSIGLILYGNVQIYKEDLNGKQVLLANLETGDIFGEVFVCANITEIPVSVVATSACSILHLNFQKMITVCTSTCAFHSQLIKNMVSIIAHKNLLLNDKIEILSKRTTRERLLYYFHKIANGKKTITLTLNREELASYLCVDRSAMSAELSRMQKDGLLKVARNTIELQI